MFKWRDCDLNAFMIWLGTIIVVSIAIYFLMRHKSRFAKELPLKLLTIFLLALEIIKQCYYMFTQYENGVFPLHFCSYFLIIYPLAHFTSEKVSKIFRPMAFCYSIMVIIMAFACPQVLLGDSPAMPFHDFLNFHAFFYHVAIFSYPFLSVALDNFKPRYKDALYVLAGLCGYCIFAVPGAFLLNVNYADILHSGVAFLDNFRLQAGQIVYDLLLFLAAGAAMCAITLVYTWIYKLITKKAKKT